MAKQKTEPQTPSLIGPMTDEERARWQEVLRRHRAGEPLVDQPARPFTGDRPDVGPEEDLLEAIIVAADPGPRPVPTIQQFAAGMVEDERRAEQTGAMRPASESQMRVAAWEDRLARARREGGLQGGWGLLARIPDQPAKDDLMTLLSTAENVGTGFASRAKEIGAVVPEIGAKLGIPGAREGADVLLEEAQQARAEGRQTLRGLTALGIPGTDLANVSQGVGGVIADVGAMALTGGLTKPLAALAQFERLRKVKPIIEWVAHRAPLFLEPFATQYTVAYKQARDQGLSLAQANKYAFLQGLSEGGITTLFGFNGAEALANPLARRTTQNVVRTILKGVFGEVSEENLQNMSSGFIDFLMLPGNEDRTVGDVMLEWARQIPDTTLIAAAGAGIGEVGQLRATREARRQAAIEFEARLQADLQAALEIARQMDLAGVAEEGAAPTEETDVAPAAAAKKEALSPEEREAWIADQARMNQVGLGLPAEEARRMAEQAYEEGFESGAAEEGAEPAAAGEMSAFGEPAAVEAAPEDLPPPPTTEQIGEEIDALNAEAEQDIDKGMKRAARRRKPRRTAEELDQLGIEEGDEILRDLGWNDRQIGLMEQVERDAILMFDVPFTPPKEAPSVQEQQEGQQEEVTEAGPLPVQQGVAPVEGAEGPTRRGDQLGEGEGRGRQAEDQEGRPVAARVAEPAAEAVPTPERTRRLEQMGYSKEEIADMLPGAAVGAKKARAAEAAPETEAAPERAVPPEVAQDVQIATEAEAVAAEDPDRADLIRRVHEAVPEAKIAAVEGEPNTVEVTGKNGAKLRIRLPTKADRALAEKVGRKRNGVARGFYDPNTNTMVIFPENAAEQTVSHEMIHFFRAAGLITQTEWNHLVDQAKDAVLPNGRRLIDSVRDPKTGKLDTEELVAQYVEGVRSGIHAEPQMGIIDRIMAWLQDVVGGLFGMGPSARKAVRDVAAGKPIGRKPGAAPKTMQDLTKYSIRYDGENRTIVDSTGARVVHGDAGARAFVRWFGDSKVVDEAGRPLVVYHGTGADFTTFERRQRMGLTDIGFHFGTADQAETATLARAYDQKTVYTTPEMAGEGKMVTRPEYVKGYRAYGPKKGARVIPAYLSIKNPVRIEDADSFNVPRQLADALVRAGVFTAEDVRAVAPTAKWESSPEQMTRFAKRLMDKGYDGIVYRNAYEGAGDSYIALDAAQVKSIFNTGQFDPSESDIRWSFGEVSETIEQHGIADQMGDTDWQTIRRAIKEGSFVTVDRVKATLPVVKRLRDTGARLKPVFDGAVNRLAASIPGAQPKIAPLKGIGRMIEKMSEDMVLDGRDQPVPIHDTVRATILVDSIADVPSAIEAIGREFEIVEGRVKDRYNSPVPGGYRDALINVAIAPGVSGEIQVVVPEMWNAKQGIGHTLYEEARAVGEETPKGRALTKRMRKVYDTAWKDQLRRSAARLSASLSNSLAEIARSASRIAASAVVADRATGLPSAPSPKAEAPRIAMKRPSMTRKSVAPGTMAEGIALSSNPTVQQDGGTASDTAQMVRMAHDGLDGAAAFMDTVQQNEMDEPVRGYPNGDVTIPMPKFSMKPKSYEDWRDIRETQMRARGIDGTELAKRLRGLDGEVMLWRGLVGKNIDLFPDGVGEAKMGPLRGNSDSLYVYSVDFSSECVRRHNQRATALEVMKRIKRGLSEDELMLTVLAFRRRGETAPCLYCYVESPRRKMAQGLTNWQGYLDGTLPVPKKDQAAVRQIRAAGLRGKDIDFNRFLDPNEKSDAPNPMLKIGKKKIAFQDFIATKVTPQVNQLKGYEEYGGQLFEIPQSKLDYLARRAGLRFQSTSDFQAEHLVDFMQVVADASILQVPGHIYTKVPELVKIIGNTRMKICTSIFAKTNPDGTVVEDEWMGMGWKDAQRFRKKYPDCGPILVAVDDAQIEWALNTDWVDYIIPLHHSGMAADYRAALNWKDYTNEQHEAWLWWESKEKVPKRYADLVDFIYNKDARKRVWSIDPAKVRERFPDNVKTWVAKGTRQYAPSIRSQDYLDLRNGTDPQRARKQYLKVCRDLGVRPVFHGVKTADGKSVVDHPGYIKLKKDFARTDTPFVPLTPDFDMKEARKVIEGYVAEGGRQAEVNQEIVDEVVERIEGRAEGENLAVTYLQEEAEENVRWSIGRPDLANPGLADPIRDVVDDIDQVIEETDPAAVRPDQLVEEEARARYLEDPKKMKRTILSKVTRGALLDDVETVAAGFLVNEYGLKTLQRGNKTDMRELVKLIYAYRRSGTKAAQAFRARRDRVRGPQQRVVALMQYLMTPTSEIKMSIDQFLDEGKVEEAARLQDQWSQKVVNMLDVMKGKGIDFQDLALGHRLTDDVKMARAMTTARGVRGDFTPGDIISEYWINAILSGPKTHIVNITGNALSAAWDFTVQRWAEAAVNSVMGLIGKRSKEGATFSELMTVYRAMMRAMPDGFKNAARSWSAEMDVFQYEVSGKETSKLEMEKFNAIPGVIGGIIRTPGRALVAADSFFKTIIARSELAGLAYRRCQEAGKKRGKPFTKQEVEDYIVGVLNNYEHPLWQKAMEKATELTFQQELKGKLGEKIMGIRNWELPGGIKPLAFVLPFVRTPYNIFAVGLRKTPLGTVSMIGRILRHGWRRGKGLASEYSLAQFQRNFAEQILAWGVFLILAKAIDQDDWEKDQPRITGTQAGFDQYGKRQFEYRAAPAMSFRFGDTYVNYGRLEPLSTSLGMMVDALNLYRSKKDGSTKAGEAIDKLAGQVKDKTFLRGISDIINAWESPENFGSRYLTNFAGSWVPNLIKQPARASQEHVQEIKGLPEYEGQSALSVQADQLVANWFPVEQTDFAPKVDLWGREVRREASWMSPIGRYAWRSLVPMEIRRVEQDRGQQLDLMLMRYNNSTAEKGYFPGAPRPTYTVAGERKKMTREQYHRYCKLAGERTLELMSQKEIWDRLDLTNPREEVEIKILEKRIASARRWAREQVLKPK